MIRSPSSPARRAASPRSGVLLRRRGRRALAVLPAVREEALRPAHGRDALPRHHPGAGLEHRRRLRRPVLGGPRRLLRRRRLHHDDAARAEQVAAVVGDLGGDRRRRCSLSLIIGSITFRLRGPYFVLASISVAEIIRLAALHFKDFTRGAEGFLALRDPGAPLIGARDSSSSPSGPSTTSASGSRCSPSRPTGPSSTRSSATTSRRSARTRTRPTRSASTWPSTRTWRWPSPRPSPPGRAGSTRMFVKFIDPNTVFGLDVSVQIVLICIIGGIGTILGPVIGAMVLVPLSEVLRNPKGLVQIGVLSPDSGFVAFIEAHLSNAHLLVYGILVVVVILFAPDGRARADPRRGARAPRGRGDARRSEPAAAAPRGDAWRHPRHPARLQVLRRPRRQLRRLLLRGAGDDHGPHRPERRRQDHALQLHHRLLPALQGRGALQGRRG